MTARPGRAAFAAVYADAAVSTQEMCDRWQVSRQTICEWARRFGLPARQHGGQRERHAAAEIVIHPRDNHCEPVDDGPGPDDPPPWLIAEKAAYIRAYNLMTMQTLQDEHCEHRRAGRCYKCRRMQQA